MYDRDQDWYTPKDPNDRRNTTPAPLLWPWVVVGLLCAFTIAYYFDGVWERLITP